MQLEYGKRYVSNNNEITGSLIQNKSDSHYPFLDPTTGFTYTEEGQFDCSYTIPHDKDLVSEYTPSQSANAIQHGGSHYKKMAIEPWDYISSNGIGYLDGSAIKYLSRWREKNGIEDLKKAIHFIEKLIEVESQKQ